MRLRTIKRVTGRIDRLPQSGSRREERAPPTRLFLMMVCAASRHHRRRLVPALGGSGAALLQMVAASFQPKPDASFCLPGGWHQAYGVGARERREVPHIDNPHIDTKHPRLLARGKKPACGRQSLDDLSAPRFRGTQLASGRLAEGRNRMTSHKDSCVDQDQTGAVPTPLGQCPRWSARLGVQSSHRQWLPGHLLRRLRAGR